MKQALILAGALLLVGCASTPETTQATVRRVATFAELAAYTGAQVDIVANPGHRAAYVAAHQALDAMLQSENYSPSEFADALKLLPIKELKGYQGAIIVTSAIVVWQDYSKEVLDLDKGVYIKPIIMSVNNGLVRALDATVD